MADMKEIKVTSTTERYAEKFHRAITQLQKAGPGGGGFNVKTIKEMERALKPVVNQFTSLSSAAAKVGKTFNTDWKKGFEQAQKSSKNMGDLFKKQLADAQNIGKAVAYYKSDINKIQYIANAALRGKGQDSFTQRKYAEDAEERWNANRNRVQGLQEYQQGTLQETGMAYGQEQIEAKIARRQAMTRKIFVGAQVAGLINNTVGQIGEGVYSFDQRRLANQATVSGFRKGLYDELAGGGGHEKVSALMESSPAMKSMVMDALSKAQFGQGIKMMGGGLKVAGAAALIGGGGAAGAFGGGMLGESGLGDIGSSFMDIMTGGAEASQAQAAGQILTNKAMMQDPKFLQAIAFQRNNAAFYSKRNQLGQGGIKDIQSTRMADYGFDDKAAAGLMDIVAARGGGYKLGQGGDTAKIATMAMQGQMFHGYQAEAGAGFMGTVASRGTGMEDRSKREFEEAIARGFAQGFKDPGVKAMYMEIVTAAASGPTGRRDNAGKMADMIGLGLGGWQNSPNNIYNQGAAMTSLQGQENWLSNSTGYLGARGFQIAGDVMQRNKMMPQNAIFQKYLGNANMATAMGGDEMLEKMMGGQNEENKQAVMQGARSVVGARFMDVARTYQPYNAAVSELIRSKRAKNEKEAARIIATDDKYSGLVTTLGAYQGDLTGNKWNATEATTGGRRALMFSAGVSEADMTPEEKAKFMGEDASGSAKRQGEDASTLTLINTLKAQMEAMNTVASPENVQKLSALAIGAKAVFDAVGASGTDPGAILDAAAKGLAAIAAEAQKVIDVSNQIQLR